MQPDITLRVTAYEHIAAYERVLRTAAWQLAQAATAKDRRYWQHQIDRADNQLLRWKAQLEKESRG